ncbi:MAG: DsbA family protein [Phototrophicaceae bacterium]
MPDLTHAIHENDHQRGTPDASEKIVIYADFTNPDLIPIENTLKNYRDSLIVYRHFPQTIKHPLAYATSQALESAGKQGKFWEMLAQILAHQANLTDGKLRQLAREINLDVAQFEDDIASVAIMTRINEDIRSAKASHITASPAIFRNGMFISALS